MVKTVETKRIKLSESDAMAEKDRPLAADTESCTRALKAVQPMASLKTCKVGKPLLRSRLPQPARL